MGKTSEEIESYVPISLVQILLKVLETFLLKCIPILDNNILISSKTKYGQVDAYNHQKNLLGTLWRENSTSQLPF